MYTHATKEKKGKKQSVANEVTQKQSNDNSTFLFVDNRHEAVAQRKLQEMANIRQGAKHLAQLHASVVQAMTAEDKVEYFSRGLDLLKKHETDLVFDEVRIWSEYDAGVFNEAIESENLLNVLKSTVTEHAQDEAAEVTGVNLVVDAPKGGNDKQWFPHPTEPIGWLQARDKGKVGAVLREIDTIIKLSGEGIPVATIINRPPPLSITTGAGTKDVFSPGGVWLLQVGAVATKKPKILGHPFAGGGQIKKLEKIIREQVKDIPMLISQLQNLIPNLGVMCKYAGEIDLAFTPAGKIVVMDVAPADGGQVVAQEEGAQQTIQKGIEGLLAALK